MIDEVRTRLRDGVSSRDIAYVSFTRKAADEAASRVKKELPDQQFPHFRTIHSMAYRQLNLSNAEIMQHSDYKEIGDALNIKFSRYYDPEESVGGTVGDRLKAVAELAQAKKATPEDIRHELAEEMDTWQLRRYVETVEQYKRDTCKVDFNDMLSMVNEPLPVRVAVIDEAQDLSRLQWDAVRCLFKNAEEIIIAGDDDQAIFRWAGADIGTFTTLKAKRDVLKQSFRVPGRVQNVANKVISQIKHRYEKDWKPRTGGSGFVDTVGLPENADLSKDGSYFLLARNGYLLNVWESVLRDAGVTYSKRKKTGVNQTHLRAIRTWEAARAGRWVKTDDWDLVLGYVSFKPRTENRGNETRITEADRGKCGFWYESLLGIDPSDASYYRAVLRRGGDLDAIPKFHINTIHGVKGGEADHVLLLTDQAERTNKAAYKQPDDEHRVFYVGVTRAKQSLTLVTPQGLNSYQISSI